MGFWHVNTIAICINHYVGAVSSFRECGLPCGLRGSLCTLQLCRLYIFTSFTVATLGMSGWLNLTQQGLSPCKKRQASLGALTFSVLFPKYGSNQAQGSSWQYRVEEHYVKHATRFEYFDLSPFFVLSGIPETWNYPITGRAAFSLCPPARHRSSIFADLRN